MEKKQDGSGTPRRGKKAIMIVGLVALILIAGVIGYAIWERPPEIAPTPGTAATPAPTPAPTAAPQDPKTGAQPSAPPEEDDPAQPNDYADALQTDREPGTYTILIVGRDYMSNSTDTIIVARMDTKKHSVDCVSIPRDTLINIAWANTPKKINAVYPGYVNSGGNGAEGLKLYIRNLVGFDVDCYSVVNIKAMEDAVDTIGGVWFDVPQNMYYSAPDQDLYIHIDAGYQLLNGSDAVKLCRYRYGYADADIGRINMQHAFLKALASQMLKLGNIPNLGTLVNILTENVETDLTAANIAWFARQFLLCSEENIHFYTMPFSNACSINGSSFVSVAQDAWLELINTALNPYTEPVTSANVNLLMSDVPGFTVWSNTGVIAGGADSFRCSECTAKNGGQVVHHLPGVHMVFEEPEAPAGTEEAPAE